MVRFYIATTLSQHEKHNTIRDWLTFEGHEITYDWTKHQALKDTNFRFSLTEAENVSEREIQGIRDADVVVVLLPGGRGTHTELGAALMGKKIIIIHSEDEKDFSLDAKTCTFYFDSLVTRIVCPLKDRVTILNEFRKKIPQIVIKTAV